ncbi:MAG: C4-dicarboxylate ABC transporter [Rhodospirillales bacterium CG15_BIG_FIL_POST_REV_8_21_14_020_66_15]|nr:MAG: C4-dicarboxylate ABC transporter [Rhodospirillales bacterium CG15_BIG_FIL_POST_REV_8_21_14_020_66_15]
MKAYRLLLAGAVAAALALPQAAKADDVKLPDTLAWSAYGTKSTGYAQAVAIGKALKDSFGVSLRIVPGKNDISRLAPLMTDKVQFSANGSGTYFASEGVFEFADKDWGPQPVRLLMSATSEANLSVGTAADANIKTPKDLKGKRVAYVRSAPALVIGTEAMLAFAGLTWDDVQKVEFSGFSQSWDGLVNGQADAAFASTASGLCKKLEASPRGIHWPAMPHDDEAGWKRLLAKAPYFVKHTATLGAGISKDKPHVGGAYPYPILITRANQDAGMVYSMTKAIHSKYDSFKSVMKEMEGWSLRNQSFTWAVPYHEAAVKYWKEIGAWTDAMEKHNQSLIKRQGVLAAAWKDMKGRKVADDAFQSEWMKVRAAALEKAGFDPVWK